MKKQTSKIIMYVLIGFAIIYIFGYRIPNLESLTERVILQSLGILCSVAFGYILCPDKLFGYIICTSNSLTRNYKVKRKSLFIIALILSFSLYFMAFQWSRVELSDRLVAQNITIVITIFTGINTYRRTHQEEVN